MSQQPENRQAATRSSRMRWSPRLVIGVVLIALFAILVAQNADHVRLTILFWEFDVRLVWVLIGAALIGAVVGWLVVRVRASGRRNAG